MCVGGGSVEFYSKKASANVEESTSRHKNPNAVPARGGRGGGVRIGSGWYGVHGFASAGYL